MANTDPPSDEPDQELATSEDKAPNQIVVDEGMTTMLQALGEALGAVTRPIADADIQKAIQTTEQEREITSQARIQAETDQLNSKILGGLGAMVLALAGLGLLTSNGAIAEKLILAIATGVGGYIAGLNKGRADKKK